MNVKDLYAKIPFLISAEEEKSFWRRWGIGWWVSVDNVLVTSCKSDAELHDLIREIKEAREKGKHVPCRIHGELNEHESIAVTEAIAAANGYHVVMAEDGEERFVKVAPNEDPWRYHQKRMRMLSRHESRGQTRWGIPEPGKVSSRDAHSAEGNGSSSNGRLRAHNGR